MRKCHRRRKAFKSNGYMLPNEGLHHLASSTCVLLFLVIVLVIGPAINHKTGSRQTGPQERVTQQFRAPAGHRPAARRRVASEMLWQIVQANHEREQP